MRYTTEAEIRNLCRDEMAESSSLEFKEQLDFETRSQRKELLKDLTGMANGGGGYVLFGIAEKLVNGESVADSPRPMHDRSIAGRVENFTRDAVHPPLLWDYQFVTLDDGFILVVEVLPSPIGPYMIEFDKDRRFYTRSLTSTVPMSEQHVRDAYALAARGQDTRTSAWVAHGLPWRPPDKDIWLVVSAVAEGPSTDVFDMRSLDVEALFTIPEEIRTYINNFQLGDLTHAIMSLARWAGGFYATDRTYGRDLSRDVRLFRDGSACLAFRIPDGVFTLRAARIANAALLYLGWIWSRHDLRRIVELRLEIVNLTRVTTLTHADGDGNRSSNLVVHGPAGIDISSVSVSRSILPYSLERARPRHGILMDFADRLHQSVGLKRADVPFRRGVLHDRDGMTTGMSVGTAEIVRDVTSVGIVATIDATGGVIRADTGRRVGWFIDGVLADLSGETVAVVEFAWGAGCPDDFVGTTLESGSAGRAQQYGLRPPEPARGDERPPTLTGLWSQLTAREMLIQ